MKKNLKNTFIKLYFILISIKITYFLDLEIKPLLKNSQSIITNINSGENEVRTEEKYIINGAAGPIHVTKISIRKNLNSNKNRKTPIQMVSNIDSFFDQLFQQVVTDMFNNQNLQNKNILDNQLQNNNINDNDNNLNNLNNKNDIDNSQDLDFSLEPEDNLNDNTKEKNKKIKTKKAKKIKKEKNNGQIVETNIKSGKGDNILTSTEKRRQIKLSRKKKLFSKICKYVFYLIVIFALYSIFKKVFELLDFIDSNENEIKISNQDTFINKVELNNKEKINKYK